MTDQPPGPQAPGPPPAPGWWLASDGRWYPPQGQPLPPQAPAGGGPGSTGPSPAPTGPQGPGAPGSQAPGWGPPAGPPPGAPGGPPPSWTPPGGAPPPGSGGSNKALFVVLGVVGGLVALVAVSILAITFLGSSPDETETSSDVTTSTSEPSGPSTLDDGGDKSEPQARALVDDLESSGAIGDLGDPELELCVGKAALEDPDLADALSSDMDPTSPEFTSLLGIIVDCGGRSFLEGAFAEGMAGSDASPTEVACVQDVLDGLDDDELVQLFADLAAQDVGAMTLLLSCVEQ